MCITSITFTCGHTLCYNDRIRCPVSQSPSAPCPNSTMRAWAVESRCRNCGARRFGSLEEVRKYAEELAEKLGREGK